MNQPEILQKIFKRLEQRIIDANGPGAVFAVSVGDQMTEFATGIANLRTGMPLTTDSRFQIGSNTKAMTGTLAFRAIEQGKLRLNSKPVDIIPGFHCADDNTTKHCTLADLLLHRSGIGSHFFKDFGRGSDAVARLVDNISDAGCDFPLGLAWGYSNAGIVVVGRMLECVYDMSYADILQQQLLVPLGMTETSQLPEVTILYPHAVGHEVDAEGKPQVTEHFLLPPAMAPAGSTVTCSARDFLKFGKLWLRQGNSATGEAVLKAKTVEQMLMPQIRVPAPLTNRWMNHLMIEEKFDGHRRILTGGQTSGQNTLMMVFPEQDAVIVAYANGAAAAQINADICEEIVEEVLALNPRIPPKAPDAPPKDIDLSPYCGTYEAYSTTIEVIAEGGDLLFIARGKNVPEHIAGEEQRFSMRSVDNHGFISPQSDAIAASFLEVGQRAQYLFLHGIFTRVEQ